MTLSPEKIPTRRSERNKNLLNYAELNSGTLQSNDLSDVSISNETDEVIIPNQDADKQHGLTHLDTSHESTNSKLTADPALAIIQSIQPELDDQETMISNQEHAKQLQNGQLVSLDNFNHFKQHIEDEFFIIKEILQQKFETAMLTQGLENMELSTIEKENNTLKKEINKLSSWNEKERNALQAENQFLREQISQQKELFRFMTEEYKSMNTMLQTHTNAIDTLNKNYKPSIPVPIVSGESVSQSYNTELVNDFIPVVRKKKVQIKAPANTPAKLLKINPIFSENRYAPLFSQNTYAPLSYGSNSSAVEKETSLSESMVLHSEDIPSLQVNKNNMMSNDKPIARSSTSDYGKKYPLTVPGNGRYSDMTRSGKKIVLIGDSMVKRVTGRRLTSNLKHGTAFVKPHLGATAKDLKDHHIQPILARGGVDAAVIMAGTNNLPKQRYWVNGDMYFTEQTADEIAKEIIDLGAECKTKGINDIFINGIAYRKDGYTEKIKQVNELLMKKCQEHHFIYIDTGYILDIDTFICRDNLHFTDIGSLAFTYNVVSQINYHYDHC